MDFTGPVRREWTRRNWARSSCGVCRCRLRSSGRSMTGCQSSPRGSNSRWLDSRTLRMESSQIRGVKNRLYVQRSSGDPRTGPAPAYVFKRMDSQSDRSIVLPVESLTRKQSRSLRHSFALESRRRLPSVEAGIGQATGAPGTHRSGHCCIWAQRNFPGAASLPLFRVHMFENL